MGYGIKKVALSFTSIEPINESQGIVRTASAKIQLDNDSEVAKVVKAEIEKHRNALFFRAKAIQADETNSNGDYFSESELIKAAPTFVGVPFYTNHNNQDIENARGKIIWAEWDKKQKAIYVIGFIDREAYPHICRGIEEEYMTGVSMGCQVEYSVCSICHNSASTIDDYCPHVKNLKGRRFSGKVKDAKTGEIRTAKNELVYEDNYGIRFIELSGVGDPACRSCRIQGIFDNDKEMAGLNQTLSKAASVANSVFMYRESSMYKDASQQEIDQLNQALQSIEDICKNLISNRKSVEVEFATDLVEILAKLQKFTDELIAAGYGQLGQGQIPGVEGNIPPPAPTQKEEPMAPVQPVSQTSPISQEVGSVSGSPSSSLVSNPTAPTPPIKPMAKNETTMKKMSQDINKLKQIAESISSKTTEEVQMRRRTPDVANKEIEQVKQGLSESWQEKQAISEYTQKTKQNIIEAIADNGGKIMKEGPDQITERQLDENFRYHTRDGDERNETTEAQLGDSKASKIYQQQDSTPVSITEKQLGEKHTDSTPDQITQKQLEKGGPRDPSSERKDSEKDSVTQKQLDDNRTGTEQNSISEKQLQDKSVNWKTIWTRASFKRTDIKTAKEHVDGVLSVLAETSVGLGVTPEQTQSAVSDMVSSVMAKNEVLDEITRETESSSNLDISARAKFYGEKGIRFASVKSSDISSEVKSGLNRLVASDSKIHPEDIVLVLETLSENEESGVKAIASAIDALIKSANVEKAKSNRRNEVRAALTVESRGSLETLDRQLAEERAKKPAEDQEDMSADVSDKEPVVAKKSPTHYIEATFEEVGLKKGMGKEAARGKISGFVKGVSAANNKKLAGITNVNVDGEKIQIAVQWENDGESQEVELSMPGDEDKNLAPETPAPEGDATGAGLDSLAPPSLEPPSANQAPMPAVASSKGKLQKSAQAPMGGAPVPPANGPGMDAAVPAPAPAATEDGVQSLTEEPIADEENAPAEKDIQNPPGSICPFCGSDDVDVGGKGLEDGTCSCNNCGAKYQLSVNIEVLNPTDVSFEKEEEGGNAEEPEAPESPNLPSMPVAASVSLDKKAIEKLAALEKENGHICPSCGTKEIKALASGNGKTEYVCPVCKTSTKKELLASVKDPSKGILRVAWAISPKNAIASGCETCKEAAMKLVAKIKVAKMVKAAQGSKFPMANCVERIARRHGLNAVATSGPCKGKPLADCVCKELEQFAITSNRKLAKLADAMMQPDEMDECLKDQMDKGYTREASSQICNTLKKLYASEADNNIFLFAWADEDDLTIDDLREMNQRTAQVEMPEEPLDGEIGDDLPELPAEDTGTAEVVTVEIPEDVAKDIAEQVNSQAPEEEVGIPEAPEAPEAPEMVAPEAAVVAQSDKQTKTAKDKKMNKEAKTPTKVDDIEHDVEAKIPRGDATLGNEGKDNIDVVEIELDIPTNGGKGMAGESAENINVKADLPDIPAGNGAMGDEAKVQKDMPGTNTEIKGTVIAKIKSVKKIAKAPDHVEHIETEVEAGIPRGDAKLGNESAENIDKPMASPEIPRGSATLGNEGKDNIDVDAKPVDVPTSNQFLGHEKEVQSGMPALEVKEKGTVIAENREKHLKKIEQARWKKAVSIAGKLLSVESIEESAFDDVVDVLSRVGLDQMETYASRMFPKKAVKKQASVQAPLAQAIVQEASGLDLPAPKDPADAFADLFTIGSKGLDENLRRFGEK